MVQNRVYQHFYYLWLLFSIVIIYSGCNQASKLTKAEHPQLTDSILIIANGLPVSEKIRFINSAYVKFTPGADDRWKRYNFIRGVYSSQREYLKASDYADSMIILTAPLAKQGKPYSDDLIKSLFAKGDTQLGLNNFESAIKYYDEADDLERIGANKGPVHFFNYNIRLATGFYQQGNYQQALSYFKQVLENKPYNNDAWLKFTFTQAQLDNIALCFSALNKPDSALYYYDKALKYIGQEQQKFTTTDQQRFIDLAKSVVYGNKAKVFLTVGRKAEAEQLLNKSVELSKNDPGDESIYSREKLAALYLERHETQKVSAMLDTLKMWADKPQYADHRMQYLKLLAGVSAQTGNFPKAYQANQQLLLLNDSLAKQKSANIQENMGRLMAYNEKVSQIGRLQRDKTLSRFLLGGAMIVLLLSAFILALLWLNFRRSRSNVRQLKLLNDEIQIRNEDLGRAFTALERSYEANARIIQLVAHDLRSPIAAMRNFAQLLDGDTLPVVERSNITRLINADCADALSLIEDMLNNNASGELLLLEQFELSDLLKQCIDRLLVKAHAKRQQVEFAPAQVIINADAEKLRRVFNNLLTNAIKFTGAKGMIKIDMHVTKTEVTVSIADNGIGIPEDIQQKLFDISAGIKRKGTSNEPSHGLGLFICRQIVEAHKGKIWFSPGVDGGAVFNVTLRRYLA
ncbi:signal transduction histidine kinase [Mucilaginibacter yixingensis]|uniref:histidine kinase n=1 Tax=Mucilaginibacter yixingensis TaxID=1295612 RepID=A0A2T5J968_9SPHI|nr:ATP-binding protein [Mucilaginibacter yixingensis]PTQ96622.1 signal transduction histidine kinase [Mucilaginibacter yixingensis]